MSPDTFVQDPTRGWRMEPRQGRPTREELLALAVAAEACLAARAGTVGLDPTERALFRRLRLAIRRERQRQ